MEKNNIFEGAKFSDRFVTRDGHITVFIRQSSKHVELIYQPSGSIYSELFVSVNGEYFSGKENDLDIVSKYHE